MLIKSTLRLLFKSRPIYLFNTPPPATLPTFKFPRRWDLKVQQDVDVYDCIIQCTQVQQLAVILKDNLSKFTDQHIGFLFHALHNLDIELDNHFYNVILPITKEYIKKFTIQESQSLSSIIQTSLYYKIEDDDFWNLVLDKLHNVPDVLVIAKGFYEDSTLNSHPVMESFGKVLSQQKGLFGMFDQDKAKESQRLSESIMSLVRSREPKREQLQRSSNRIEDH